MVNCLTIKRQYTISLDQSEGREITHEKGGTVNAFGSKALREAGSHLVELDPCSDEEAVAQGAYLGIWEHEDFKEEKNLKPYVDLSLFRRLCE
ncbi:hypothetical protein QYM36_004344 [Artemia franciscana]|uniref:Uncharacterized protein n=1 Tax=Artemia franciscana TaxID=6661 RepID=A0AA88I2I8_ARTSF|nr:hypothetical protein QYM36_004344 [Artemia franciscana]